MTPSLNSTIRSPGSQRQRFLLERRRVEQTEDDAAGLEAADA